MLCCIMLDEILGHVRLGEAVPRRDVQSVCQGLPDPYQNRSVPQRVRPSRDVEGEKGKVGSLQGETCVVLK